MRACPVRGGRVPLHCCCQFISKRHTRDNASTKPYRERREGLGFQDTQGVRFENLMRAQPHPPIAINSRPGFTCVEWRIWPMPCFEQAFGPWTWPTIASCSASQGPNQVGSLKKRFKPLCDHLAETDELLATRNQEGSQLQHERRDLRANRSHHRSLSEIPLPNAWSRGSKSVKRMKMSMSRSQHWTQQPLMSFSAAHHQVEVFSFHPLL